MHAWLSETLKSQVSSTCICLAPTRRALPRARPSGPSSGSASTPSSMRVMCDEKRAPRRARTLDPASADGAHSSCHGRRSTLSEWKEQRTYWSSSKYPGHENLPWPLWPYLVVYVTRSVPPPQSRQRGNAPNSLPSTTRSTSSAFVPPFFWQLRPHSAFSSARVRRLYSSSSDARSFTSCIVATIDFLSPVGAPTASSCFLSSPTFIFFGLLPASASSSSAERFFGGGAVAASHHCFTFPWSSGLSSEKPSSSSSDSSAFGFFWHSRCLQLVIM
mmetsp:Transcript_14285/g.24352  ORF Transcript_14285/g.24352 Transcript_14285/m.24352 type:complete len:274 (-) Transcript_14285:151-972(-)